MSTAKVPRDERWLSSIDLLRGLAALAVVVHHLYGSFWRWHETVFEGHAAQFFHTRPLAEILTLPVGGFGFLGVPLFFVISGFCIHIPLAGGDQPLHVRSFFIRRFFRLYPLYFAVFSAVMVLMAVKSGVAGDATWSNFIGHALFWQYNVKGPGLALGISPVLWSVAVEVHFYFLYALLLPLLRRVGFGRCALFGMIIDAAYRVWWASLGPHHAGLHEAFTPFHFAPARFGEWLLGAWIAEAYVRRRLGLGPVPDPHARIALGWALIAAAIAGVALLGVDRYWLDVPTTLGFALILAGLVAREQRVGPPAPSPFWRIAKWLGDRSYSLYLVHYTVISVIVDVFARMLKLTTTEQKSTMAGTPVMFAAIAIACIAIPIVTDLAYRFIELPAHQMGRRLGAKAKGIPVRPS